MSSLSRVFHEPVALKAVGLKANAERVAFCHVAWVPLAQIPLVAQLRYGVMDLAADGKVLLEIPGGVYEFPQAGCLAQETLIAHLAEHGYHMTSSPEAACFRHDTRNIQFTLIVDDFVPARLCGRFHIEFA